MVVADALADAGDVAKQLREVADPTLAAVQQFKEFPGEYAWMNMDGWLWRSVAVGLEGGVDRVDRPCCRWMVEWPLHGCQRPTGF